MAKIMEVLPFGRTIKAMKQSVDYKPSVAIAIGCPLSTIFICQLTYWASEIDDDNQSNWIKKTAKEIYAATGIPDNSQITIRKKLVAMDILIEDKMGLPATLHFKVNYNRFDEILTNGLDKKKDRNSEQAKGKNGRFTKVENGKKTSVSENFGNLKKEETCVRKCGDKVSESMDDKFPKISETTYKEDIIKNIEECVKDALTPETEKKRDEFLASMQSENVVKNTAAANYNQSTEKVIVELPQVAKEEKYDNRDAVRNALVQILKEDESWVNGLKQDYEFAKINWIDENQNTYIMTFIDNLFKESEEIPPLSKNQLKAQFRKAKWIVTKGNDLVKQNFNNQTQFSKNGSNAYQTGVANNGKPKHHRLTNRIDELCEAVLGPDSDKCRENGTDVDPFDQYFALQKSRAEQAEFEEVG